DRVAPADVDEWYLCGPAGLLETARATLLAHEVPAERVHVELFHVPESSSHVTGMASTVTVRLGGREHAFELSAGQSVLDGALTLGPDAPYACMGGACGTCKAKLVSGPVEMDHTFALGRADLDAGYVLTCQSQPTSAEVTVDYDG